LSEPSETAVKTLFTESGNVCFFYDLSTGKGCEEKLTIPTWKRVNAEIAHIKGELPKSGRYDEAQPDTERQGYYNLMLLCPKHHKIIDWLRPDDYPVEVLTAMKDRHANCFDTSECWPPSDAELVAFARQAIEDAVRSAAAQALEVPMSTEIPGETAQIAVDAPAGGVVRGLRAAVRSAQPPHRNR